MYSYGNHFVEDNLIPPSKHMDEYDHESAPCFYGGKTHHHGKGGLIDSGTPSEFMSLGMNKDFMNIIGDDGVYPSEGRTKGGAIFQSGMGTIHKHHLVQHHPLSKLMKPHHRGSHLHEHVGGNILLSLLPTLLGSVAGPLINKIADVLFPHKGEGGAIFQSGMGKNFHEDPEEAMVMFSKEMPEYLHKILDMMEYMMEKLDKVEMELFMHEGEDKGLVNGCGLLLNHMEKHGNGVFSGMGIHLKHKHHLRHKKLESGLSKEEHGAGIENYTTGNGLKDIPIIGPLLGMFGIG
jgi:hypothetical protein